MNKLHDKIYTAEVSELKDKSVSQNRKFKALETMKQLLKDMAGNLGGSIYVEG